MNKRKSKSLAAIFMAMVMVFSAVVTMSAADAELQELQLSYTDYEDAHYYDCCSSTVQPHQMVTCWLFGCWDSGVTRESWRVQGSGNSAVCFTTREYVRNECGWTWVCTGIGFVESLFLSPTVLHTDSAQSGLAWVLFRYVQVADM